MPRPMIEETTRYRKSQGDEPDNSRSSGKDPTDCLQLEVISSRPKL